MAIVSWADFANGDKGDGIRASINAAMTAIRDWINAKDTVISGHTTSIADLVTADTNLVAADAALSTRIDDLEATGLVVLSGNSLTPQSIATSATKVILFDTKEVEAGVGAVGDVVTNKATATLSGVFKLRFEAFVSYASNVDITWQMYKNGVAFGNTITLSGQGTKVFPITLLTSANLTTNDYLELYATASATTDLTVSQANGTLEKTHF